MKFINVRKNASLSLSLLFLLFLTISMFMVSCKPEVATPTSIVTATNSPTSTSTSTTTITPSATANLELSPTFTTTPTDTQQPSHTPKPTEVVYEGKNFLDLGIERIRQAGEILETRFVSPFNDLVYEWIMHENDENGFGDYEIARQNDELVMRFLLNMFWERMKVGGDFEEFLNRLSSGEAEVSMSDLSILNLRDMNQAHYFGPEESTPAGQVRKGEALKPKRLVGVFTDWTDELLNKSQLRYTGGPYAVEYYDTAYDPADPETVYFLVASEPGSVRADYIVEDILSSTISKTGLQILVTNARRNNLYGGTAGGKQYMDPPRSRIIYNTVNGAAMDTWIGRNFTYPGFYLKYLGRK